MPLFFSGVFTITLIFYVWCLTFLTWLAVVRKFILSCTHIWFLFLFLLHLYEVGIGGCSSAGEIAIFPVILVFVDDIFPVISVFVDEILVFLQVFHGQPMPTTVAIAPHPPAMRPRVRARRGQATDPHSIAERVRLM